MLNTLTSYLPDAILILISGSACLYCAALNRRLKNLSNLKTGVGASILSLTEAIAQTHRAAQDAQNTTLQTTETLRHLLERAESEAPKIEVGLVQLERAQTMARKECEALTKKIDQILASPMEQAKLTASEILSLLKEVDKHRLKVERKLESKDHGSLDSNELPSAETLSKTKGKAVDPAYVKLTDETKFSDALNHKHSVQDNSPDLDLFQIMPDVKALVQTHQRPFYIDYLARKIAS